MTRCKLPEFYESYKIVFGIQDLKSKRILPTTVKERIICLYNHKNHCCDTWNENRKNSLLNGLWEIGRNFNFIKNKMNGNNLSQRIRYRFPKHETVDQLENVFVIDLET